MDIATVVRTLYHRKKVKELPILERKLYDSALKLLIDEVSFSLDVSKEEVEEMIFSKLEVEVEREEEEEEEEAFEEEDDIDVDLEEDEE